MRAILKQGLFVLIALGVMYAFLLALSYALVPSVNRRGGLDSSLAGDTIFMTDPKYVFLNRAALRPECAPHCLRRRLEFVGRI